MPQGVADHIQTSDSLLFIKKNYAVLHTFLIKPIYISAWHTLYNITRRMSLVGQELLTGF
jgi:hypothetical protein